MRANGGIKRKFPLLGENRHKINANVGEEEGRNAALWPRQGRASQKSCKEPGVGEESRIKPEAYKRILCGGCEGTTMREGGKCWRDGGLGPPTRGREGGETEVME